MIAFLFKNPSFVISKHTSIVCRSSPVSFSFSLRPFSNSAQTQLGIGPTILDVLLHKYEFPPELASRVASELSYLKTPEKVDSALSFFRDSGFSNTQLVRIAKYRPQILSASLEGILKPKIQILQDMGIPSDGITKIISINPRVLDISLKGNLIPSLSVLKALLGSNQEVAKVITRSPWFLNRNFQNTVVPNVDFLKSCGIPMERIRIILLTQPSAFLTKPEIMRRCVEKAKEMGLNASSDNFIYAVSTLTLMSNESWELKLQAFRDLGFSDSDILTMFKKAPAVFFTSIEKIKKVKELLLATRKFNLCSIVNYPKSLASSIENRYIPRLRILGILESLNLIDNWPALSAVSMLSDDEFLKRFVSPYSNEVTDLCLMKSADRK